MIITRLIGGLGNQMFQYAAGKSLSTRLQTPLKLDLSHYKKDLSRFYCLDCFDIQADIASSEEAFALSGIPSTFWERIASIQRRGLYKAGRLLGVLEQSAKAYPSLMVDRRLGFAPELIDLSGDIYLHGYWQSEKYFKDNESQIRCDFVVKNQLHGKNLDMANIIKENQSVSLHIRRGDYVSNLDFKMYHGVLTQDYYEKAISYLVRFVRDPYFFVFSDDPIWTAEHFKVDYPVIFVEHNDASIPWEDLRLMSLCKHHIIANSSFSWWGAWLGSAPNKIVLAPKNWYADPNEPVKDLIPDHWKTI